MKVVRNELLVGDIRQVLPRLPAGSVDCVITSPPYFRLRDYGDAAQIGLETDVDGWVDELVAVTREIGRVLKPTGSMWLCLDDTYARHERAGAPPKSLVLAPERLALAMIGEGWVIRNKVIWAKTNPMPASVRDRLSPRWETIYFATRARHYHFDLDAIRIPHRSQNTRGSETPGRGMHDPPPSWAGPHAGNNRGLEAMKARGLVGHPLGKNPGDVWTFPTASSQGAHHATFPLGLIRRPMLATCPERTCVRCGQPWTSERPRQPGPGAVADALRPACACQTAWQPGLVLDPFMGAGTVAIVAEQHQRDWLGIELNPAFAAGAIERITTARANQASAA